LSSAQASPNSFALTDLEPRESVELDEIADQD
jgi:hypothetical protein